VGLIWGNRKRKNAWQAKRIIPQGCWFTVAHCTAISVSGSSSLSETCRFIYKYIRRQKGTWCTWSQIPDLNVNTCKDNEWSDLNKILYCWNQHWTQLYNCTPGLNTNDVTLFFYEFPLFFSQHIRSRLHSSDICQCSMERRSPNLPRAMALMAFPSSSCPPACMLARPERRKEYSTAISVSGRSSLSERCRSIYTQAEMHLIQLIFLTSYVNTCKDNEWNDLNKILYCWNQHWTRFYNCTPGLNTNDVTLFFYELVFCNFFTAYSI
jgi:hypothetical protein